MKDFFLLFAFQVKLIISPVVSPLMISFAYLCYRNVNTVFMPFRSNVNHCLLLPAASFAVIPHTRLSCSPFCRSALSSFSSRLPLPVLVHLPLTCQSTTYIHPSPVPWTRVRSLARVPMVHVASLSQDLTLPQLTWSFCPLPTLGPFLLLITVANIST